MHFIYSLPVCPPICPPLGNNHFNSSSEENLNQRRKFLPNQKLNLYKKSIGHHFIFSSTNENFNNEKDIDEEFDEISLSDNYDVSYIGKRNFTYYLNFNFDI